MAPTSRSSTPKKTKAQLLLERREALGRCKNAAETKQGIKECKNWATDESGYCGTHINSALTREFERARATEKKKELDDRIEEYIEWTRDHPSVWDSKRQGIGGHRGQDHREAAPATAGRGD